MTEGAPPQLKLYICNDRADARAASELQTFITSKWVEYEWRLFLGELLDDRKQGNLITVVAEDLQFSDLPISLRNRESIKMNEFNRIINYIK